MLTIVDKKTLFQDRYQVLILPVPVSGIFRQRQLLKLQSLYPDYYINYKQTCERGEFGLGEILVYQTQRDLAGMGVGGALSKPKFMVNLGVTEFAENRPHYEFVKASLQAIEKTVFDWGRYGGIKRLAMLATDDLILPEDKDFEQDILPLFEKYLQPMSGLNVLVYR